MVKKTNKIEIYTTPRLYVSYWFETRQRSIRDTFSDPNIFKDLHLDYEEEFKVFRKKSMEKFSQISKASMEDAFDTYVSRTRNEQIKKALDHLKNDVDDITEVKKWVRAVTGAELENDVAVMCHWIWLIKRKAYEKSVKYQIMPILYGKQGGGKSVSVEKLIEPISDYRLSMSLHQLCDERFYQGLSYNFVGFFDELQGAKLADMDALKRQITTTTNSYRVYYTQNLVSVPMKCAFIGATNKPVADSLYDTTGMRRFWEIKTLDKLDWDLLASVDFIKLWKGINENLDSGYLEGVTLENVLSAQKVMQAEDDLETFIIESNLKLPENYENYVEKCQQELYDDFCQWATRSGIRNVPKKSVFARRLSTKLDHYQKRDDKTIRRTYYKINPESGLAGMRLLTNITAIKGG